MEKMDMMSMDRVQENIAKIRALFPECVTEVKRDGKVTLAVDFDELKQEMSGMLIDEREERYQMTWPDKRKAKLLANTSISATLRPCKEESVDFDNTQNLYIEGDNLDVLKLLQETYLGKVKMIYIDPPYNTGSDFVYEDDFAQSAEEYVANSGQYDDQGNRLVENKETNGRFHTDWLNMIYPRLKVARDLLTDDGVIFITLDDGENANVRKICNEIFGEDNFITEFIWEKKKKPSFLHRNVGKIFDYILCYAKNAIYTSPFSVERTTEGKKYPINNAGNGRSTIIFPPKAVRFAVKDGVYEPQDMSEGNILTVLKNQVVVNNYYNQTEIVLEGEWRYSQKKINEIIAEGDELYISKVPFRPNHIKSGGEIKKMKNILSPNHYNCATNEDATKEITDLFGSIMFDTPKPVRLLQLLIQSVTYNDADALVMDFFSGSATTAHAVMQLNAEDGGNRKFIMVQLPELCNEQSAAYKEGYKNICEIGKERIRRAGKIIKENINALRPVVDEITDYEKETGQIRVARTWGNGITGRTNYAANATETFIDAKTGQRITHEYEETDPKDHYRFHPEDLDVGFRVLKLDSSNMKDVYYKAEDYAQTMIAGLEDNVKEDRTPLDLLFQVMLDLGQELSAKIEEKTIAGKTVWCVEGNNIIACFDSDINDKVVTEIAKLKPLYAVFRDSSFVSDAAAANCEQIFASISPATSRRVI